MTEIKNENVTVDVTREPGSKVKFKISVSPKATQAAYSKAIKNINKEVSLPGFRKGKAPEALIVQNFGSHVNEEWNNVLLNTAFQEAVTLSKIYPLSEKSVNKPQVKSLSRESGAQIEVDFEAVPEVPSINLNAIKIHHLTPKAVSQEDIEDRIHDLLVNNAEWENVEDRGVTEGDYVELTIDSLDNPGHKICENQRFLVQEGKIGQWMHKLLIGKNVNAVMEATSEQDPCKACEDPTHEPHEHNFKPTRCQITLNAIKKAKLPQVDDDFAKKLGAENAIQFRERVEATLKRDAEEDAKDKMRRQVEKQLIEDYPFEVPQSLIKAQLQNVVKHHAAETNDQTKRKELEEKVRKELTEVYRLYFICEKIAQEHNIEVSQDEIMQEFMVQAYMTRPEDSFLDANMDPKEIRSRIHSHVLSKKVKDYLVSHATKKA